MSLPSCNFGEALDGIEVNAVYSSRFEEELLFKEQNVNVLSNPGIISTSGSRGHDGKAGSGAGAHGFDAAPGQNAERNIVGIRASGDSLIVTHALSPVNNSSGFESFMFPLSNYARISLLAQGGQGGQGGSGCRGFTGCAGERGHGADSSGPGTDGGKINHND